jgi:Kef-type K+ transport system membrane component KefB
LPECAEFHFSFFRGSLTLNTVVADVIGDIALVIVVSSVLGAVARRCGQPAVIGQIMTGVLLGPTVLGRLPGHVTSHLFPHEVLPYLTVLAQVAVAIFMFAVGYEIDVAKLRGRGRTVPLIAAGALTVPMMAGMASVLLFRSMFAAVGEPRPDRSFVLFMGVAVSITAMPVLASIVRERGLAGTTAGVTATAAAGIMDVAAWLLLAAALIGAGHSSMFSLPVTVLLTACFAAFLLFVVPRAVSWWNRRTEAVLSSQVPLALALAMGSAWITTSLGLQAVFGGFVAGIALRAAHREPDPDVLRALDLGGNLLLPLFFIVTGLSLDIGAVGGDGFVLLAVVLVVAAAGKLGPAYAFSRIRGLDRRESATIAALVNTRGLTELIALNVGLADGLIGKRLFTILVLMALITTMMTAPLLALIRRSGTPRPAQEPARRVILCETHASLIVSDDACSTDSCSNAATEKNY